jgi:N-acetylmuramoyl-L-alanine amidase
MKIVLDAGHGPNTPGKRSPDGSLREYQFNSAVARYVADALLHGYEGVDILLTHADDRDVPLKERTDKANAWKADLFVSIHANAAGDGGWNSAQGIETFVYDTRPPAAVALANAVQRQLIRATGRPDRGVKSANFHVLRETRMTAILIECGFMTNREECELLKSDEYRRKCAEAIVAGIVETYGLRPKQPAQPTVEGWRSEFAEARVWAVEQGITDGSRPKDTVTREDLWVMLYRAFGAQK